MEIIKKTKKIFRIFFALGIAIMLLTAISLAVCALACPSAVNVSFTSIFPLVMVAFFGVNVHTGFHGEIRDMDRNNVKYSKLGGKGYFYRPPLERRKYPELGCVALFLTSLYLPLIFFFSDDVKFSACTISIMVLLAVSLVLAPTLAIIAVVNKVKKRKKENEEAERLRQDQERSEELGRWK